MNYEYNEIQKNALHLGSIWPGQDGPLYFDIANNIWNLVATPKGLVEF